MQREQKSHDHSLQSIRNRRSQEKPWVLHLGGSDQRISGQEPPRCLQLAYQKGGSQDQRARHRPRRA